MGDVIYLHERVARRDNRGAAPTPSDAGLTPPSERHLSGGLAPAAGSFHGPPMPSSIAFFFELSCPFSYLAAERVERALGEVTWVPTAPLDRGRAAEGGIDSDLIAGVEQEAVALRLPLVLPECYPRPFRKATRAAAYASANGAGPRLALAAFRLAFCGGFDLDESDVLAEAAAAAGLAVPDLLKAAKDPRWDIQPNGAARGLLGHGIASVPAVRVANRWFEGIDAVSEASLFTSFSLVHGVAGG
jgi:2-hydroxychromene-2-carboxylate isomerase